MQRRDLFRLMPALAAAPWHAAEPAVRSRLRSAICAYSFRRELESGAMRYDDLVRMAVDLDLDGLDLTVYWFPNTTDEFLMPLRNLANRSGVPIYSISIRTNMCQPTAELQAKEVASIRQWVDVASKLGAGHIRVFGGDVPRGRTEDEAADWVTEILTAASSYAAAHGVILGLENHGGITLRAERIIQIVKKVNSPWVGINLDTGNFRENFYEQIRMCLPYAVNAQFKTVMRGLKGEVEPSDWERIVKMFAESGYKGYLALEYEENRPAREAFPPLMRKLRDLARQHSRR